MLCFRFVPCERGLSWGGRAAAVIAVVSGRHGTCRAGRVFAKCSLVRVSHGCGQPIYKIGEIKKGCFLRWKQPFFDGLRF